MSANDLDQLLQGWGDDDPEEAFATAFDSFFTSQKPMFSLGERGWVPPTDICEFAHCVQVRMEVAGLDENDLDITVDGTLLRVKGRRVRESRKGQKPATTTFHLMEIRHGTFERIFGLPPKLDMDDVKATYDDGFLVIEIPKIKSTRRNIPIEGE